ncbi:hypothetical protein ACOMHN_014133 [Nucella lapillus]
MVNDCLQCCLTRGRQQGNSCAALCTPRCARSVVKRMFPFLGILRGYSCRYDLPRDVVAGLTVGIMHVPQGLAYALLVGLPAVYGLYTSLYPSIIYFFFGTARHVSVGTFSVVSLMLGEVLKEGVTAWQLQDNPPLDSLDSNTTYIMQNGTQQNTEEVLQRVKVAYVLSATFVAGLFQILLGITRVGRVASFMSDALISGFTMGAALHVLPSQIHCIFGLHFDQHIGMFKFLFECRDFFMHVHKMQWVPLVTSLVTMLILVMVREGINNNKKTFPHLPVPVPVELLLVIGATVVSHYAGYAPKYNVQTIGVIPSGIPSVDISVLRFVPQVLSKALVIGVIAFSLSFATARILEEKHSYDVDANQELVALGVANMLGPLLSCFCCSVSMSRSMVQDEVGGKTQVTGLISSLLVLVVLLFIGPLLHSLPNCVLSAIIVVSLKRLYLQCTLLPRFWRISKTDFTVWLVVFLSSVILDVDIGLLCGLIFSLFAVLFKTQAPHTCLLGRIRDTEMYADVNGRTKVLEVPGVKIFRFEAALYFGNVQNFRSCLESETGLCLQDLKHDQTKKEDLGHKDKSKDQSDSLKASSFKDYKTLTDSSLPFPPEPVRVIVLDLSPQLNLDSMTLTVLTQVMGG